MLRFSCGNLWSKHVYSSPSVEPTQNLASGGGEMMKALAFLLFVPVLHAQTASPDQIRSAATRAVATVQRGSAGFYKSAVCFSCHDHGLPMLALRTARQHGIPVDEAAAGQVAAKGLLTIPDL